MCSCLFLVDQFFVHLSSNTVLQYSSIYFIIIRTILLTLGYFFWVDKKKQNIAEYHCTHWIRVRIWTDLVISGPGQKPNLIYFQFFQKEVALFEACLICVFKQHFSVFKQYFTHFHTFFYSHVFSQIFSNNNFQFLNTYTKRSLGTVRACGCVFLLCLLTIKEQR